MKTRKTFKLVAVSLFAGISFYLQGCPSVDTSIVATPTPTATATP